MVNPTAFQAVVTNWVGRDMVDEISWEKGWKEGIKKVAVDHG